MESGGESAKKEKKERKSEKKSEKKKKSAKKDKVRVFCVLHRLRLTRGVQKRSRDEGKADEPATTPVGAKKAKEEDVKPDVKPVVSADKEKPKKARKPKEPRVLRHFPLSPIAHPLASAEQQAALFALLEKAAKAKQLRRGVKEIQKVRARIGGP